MKLSVLLTELQPLIIVIVLLAGIVDPALVRAEVLIALLYCEKYFTAFISKLQPFHAITILIIHLPF